MELVVTEDADELARAGARIVVDVVRENPTAQLMPATGNTPMGLYRELVKCSERGELDASRLRIVQLDDYLGLGPDDPRSLFRWMATSLLLPLGIDGDRVIAFDTRSRDPDAACRDFDAAVSQSGGIDLVVLGLGPNGHLGFNEPPSDASSPTRVIELSDESIESNSAYWGGRDRVPRRAITAGMNLVLAAQSIVLLVSGGQKADILQRALHGPVTPEVPASYLQGIPNVTVIADRAAARSGGPGAGT